MRGTPYLRLRRSVVRAFRRAVAGTMVLAVLSIAIAVGAATSLEPSEGSVRRFSNEFAAVGPAVAAAQVGESQPAPPTAQAPSAASEPTLAPTVAAADLTRRTRTSAVQQFAGPPPQTLSIEERREALVEQAAERTNAPPIVEPATVAEPPPDDLLLAQTDAEDAYVATPPIGPGDFIEATVSFYYCEQGDTADSGDGGGFCGPMRDGTVVYEGAAACSYEYIGQRFRIVGDPIERIYTCNDTGSAVSGLHRDIFFNTAADGWAWQAQVGTRVTLAIVE